MYRMHIKMKNTEQYYFSPTNKITKLIYTLININLVHITIIVNVIM